MAREEGFIARKPRDGRPYFVAAILRMTGEEGRRKEEAGPSPIRASRVWAQDDTKNNCERRRQKQRQEQRQKTGPCTPKGRPPVNAGATSALHRTGVAIGAKTDPCTPLGPGTRKGYGAIRPPCCEMLQRLSHRSKAKARATSALLRGAAGAER